jgi:hypothetical protein
MPKKTKQSEDEELAKAIWGEEGFKAAPGNKPKKWQSPAPTECQLCNQPLKDHFIDAYIPSYGQWGIACVSCGKMHGCKFGTGLGQRYSLKTLEKLEG